MLENLYNFYQNKKLKIKSLSHKEYSNTLEKNFNIKLYNSQLIASESIAEGNITEVETGQGKTFIAFLSACNVFKKGIYKKIFIATSNDYLAKRDCELLYQSYKEENINPGFVNQFMTNEQKKRIYDESDVIYGTLTEFGFDILRTGMRINNQEKIISVEDIKQYFLIIDEVDYSILDEATTPLIISEPNIHSKGQLIKIYSIAKELADSNKYTIDEKSKRIELNDDSYDYIEKLSIDSLYSSSSLIFLNFIESAITAIVLYEKDVDYVIHNQDIVIVDENSGRLGIGRQLGEGLHQFLQIKENLEVTPESRIKAKLTYSSLLQMFGDFSGMSGTIYSSKEEIELLFNKRTIVVKPDNPSKRIIHSDILLKTNKDVINEVINIAIKESLNDRPVLIISKSIKESQEIQNKILSKNSDLVTQLLNAQNEKEESDIIFKAGRKGVITISTAMAGRGTDIKIVGTSEEQEKINKAGGLVVIVCERNLSRRVDEQVAGRTGRNGKRGEVYFISSLENDLFSMMDDSYKEKVSKYFDKIEKINNKMMTKIIKNIQNGLQMRFFQMRKNESMYDSEIINSYNIYLKNREAIINKDPDDFIYERIVNLSKFILDEIKIKNLKPENFGLIDFNDEVDEASIQIYLQRRFDDYSKKINKEVFANIIKGSDLNIIDNYWSDFLSMSNILKKHAELQKNAQKKPFYEFQKNIIEINKNFWGENGVFEIESLVNSLRIRIIV